MDLSAAYSATWGFKVFYVQLFEEDVRLLVLVALLTVVGLWVAESFCYFFCEWLGAHILEGEALAVEHTQ